jgi:vancomycin resistance protein YoaR
VSTDLTDHAGARPEPHLPATRPHVRRARPPRRGNLVINALLILLALAITAAGTGLYLLDRNYQGKIYPNVTVQGINVGELTPQEAEAALRARYGAFITRPATISHAGRTWEPTLEELGIAFDFEGATNSAYRAGRGNGLLANIAEVYAIWRDGLDLPLRVSFDQAEAQRYLAALAAEIEQTPLDAQLRFDVAAATATTRPSRIGRQVLVDQTLQELTEGLKTFTPTSVVLQSRELLPRLDTAAVEEARSQIATILQSGLMLTVRDQQYDWPPADLARLLDVARIPADDGDTLSVTIDQVEIERRITEIADQTALAGELPRVAWNNGDLQIIRDGKPGQRLDETRARDMILGALAGESRALALPLRPVDPPVTAANLDQLGINELVSVGKSDFSGSADYRIHNIGAGMRILNGILLAPGAEFSFNTYIGSIDAKNGFVEGAAIVQNRTQQEFGGGICQDSTTMFRAAFWAGLPITERWGHSFYISWYNKYALGPQGDGPGLDATIFTGGPDLRFVNDTGAWLLIQAWSDPKTGVAQVEFYGTRPNRSVELTHRVYDRLPAPGAPVFVADSEVAQGAWKQTDRARGGMTIDVYRTVTENGAQRAPELFRTRFKPWPNIYAFNPADLGSNGRPLIPWGAAAAPAPADPTTPPPADPNAQPQPPQPPPANETAPPAEPPPAPTGEAQPPADG